MNNPGALGGVKRTRVWVWYPVKRVSLTQTFLAFYADGATHDVITYLSDRWSSGPVQHSITSNIGKLAGYCSTTTVVIDTDLIMTKNSPTPVIKWRLSSPSLVRARGGVTLLSLLHLYLSR